MAPNYAEKCPVMVQAHLSGHSNVGPQDIHTLELLSQFNREKIPERAVHALGAGAYGEFEVGAILTPSVACDYIWNLIMLVTRLPTTSPTFAMLICSSVLAKRRPW